MVERIITGIERSREERIETLYQSSLAQHARLAELGEERVRAFIGREIDRIDSLEEDAARDDENRLEVSDDIARDVAAIWVLSGPGAYDKPVGNDRYSQFPWARGMDRTRLNRAAILARKVAEKRSGKSLGHATPSSMAEHIAKTKELVAAYGPVIIYNGNPEQNQTLDEVILRERLIIPREKLFVIHGKLDNTVDQMKTFRVPDGFESDGKEIALVSHAPHLERAVLLASHYNPFPPGLIPRLFPISTPEAGREIYEMMEIRGMLYYTFISGDGAEDAMPVRGRFEGNHE